MPPPVVAPPIYTTQGFAQSQGVKALVYAKAGMGKTFLATTCDRPFVIATEPGLLSLRKYNIPFTQATTLAQLHAVADWIASGDQTARMFSTFFIDSMSEVLEIVLAEEMRKVGAKEPRRAYNELLKSALELIRKFRDLSGPNVIFLAKEEYSQDDNNAMMYRPKFPGRQMGIEAPYFFDEVWQLHLYRHTDGRDYRVFRCHPTNQHEAKDRSGALDAMESANLRDVFAKIEAK
jgi:hypothetical protein